MSGHHDAKKKLENSFVIACNNYDSEALRSYANVIIPTCTFAEMSGTFINMIGNQQRFNAAISPIGESKAGWKVIAAVAQTMQLEGFNYPHSQAVVDEFSQHSFLFNPKPSKLPETIKPSEQTYNWVEFDHPYNVDPITRHANSLQLVAHDENSIIRINSGLAETFSLTKNGQVTIKFGTKEIMAYVIIDDLVADKTFVVGKNIANVLPKNCKIELKPNHAE